MNPLLIRELIKLDKMSRGHEIAIKDICPDWIERMSENRRKNGDEYYKNLTESQQITDPILNETIPSAASENINRSIFPEADDNEEQFEAGDKSDYYLEIANALELNEHD